MINNRFPYKVHNLHLDLLADTNQDSEVRIAAFLSAMRCPSSSSLVRISEILSNEEYKQGTWPSTYTQDSVN